MIFNGKSLLFEGAWEFNREVKPPERIFESTKVAGRNGELIRDSGVYTDAEYSYTFYLKVSDEYDRQYKVRKFSTELKTGKKCELVDPRDGGLRANAILTELKHESFGIEPLYEKFELTFQLDPYLKSAYEYKQSLPAKFKNFSEKPVGFIAELEVTSDVERVSLSSGDDRLDLVHLFRAGDNIYIDTNTHEVKINGQNAMNTVSLLTDFFKLPQGDVELKCTGATGSIRYYEEYLVG